MNNIRSMPCNDPLYDQASQWIVKMDKGLSRDEETALREWLQADPQSYAILMEMTRLWDKMDAMSRLSDLFAKPTVTPSWRSVRNVRALSAMAASVVLAAVVGLWALLGGLNLNSAVYQTAVGEQSSVMLPDGTQLTLNTNTKVTVHYTEQQRQLQLSSGEIHISVAKDPQRPLSVMAAGQLVQALGTEFNIEITDQQNIELVVTEGRVKVAVQPNSPAQLSRQAQQPQPDNTLTLAAGEQVTLGSHNQAVTQVSADELEVKLSWREGNLIFRGESLEEAVKEIGRYTSVEFIFINEDLKKMRVAGMFKAGDVEGLLATLRENFNIVSERDGAGNVLLSAK